MPAARRTWAALRSEIYEWIGETETDDFATPTLIRNIFNTRMRLREMQLHQAHEGFSNEDRYVAVTAAVNELYDKPEDMARITSVAIEDTDGNTKNFLPRHTRYGGESITTGEQTLYGASRTYEEIGNHIHIHPPFTSNATGRLVIRGQIISDRVSSDGDKLPAGWPLFLEDLLILDTALAFFHTEEAQGQIGQTRMSTLVFERRQFEAEFLEYVETRSFGRTFAVPFRQGA